MTLTRSISSLLTCLLLAAPAAAQQPQDEPGAQPTLDIQSEHLALDPDAGHATFDGDVQLRRGNLHLRCDRLEATVDPQGGPPSFVRASGHVRVAFGDLFAQAAHAEYDRATDRLTLTGDPVLWRRGARLQGERVSLHLPTRAVQIDKPRGTLANAPLTPEAAP